jgi:hypothetical protein
MKEEQKGEILIYQAEQGNAKIEVRLENENVWLSQAQLVELYQSSKSNISEHIKHIFEEGELSEELVVRKFRTTTKHGAMPTPTLKATLGITPILTSSFASRIWKT